MARTGRTGADAVFRFLEAICRTIVRYRLKLDQVIDAAVENDIITSGQGDTAKAFVDTASTVCTIFGLIAAYSGFETNPAD